MNFIEVYIYLVAYRVSLTVTFVTPQLFLVSECQSLNKANEC